MLENSEKIVFDQKEPFFGKLETFLQHILEYRKKYFSREKYFFVTDLGGLLLKGFVQFLVIDNSRLSSLISRLLSC